MLTRFWRIAFVIALTAATGGLELRRASAQESDRLNVVATFSILGDIVQNVGGDNIDLTVIVGSGADSHTFEPNPEQLAAIANADIIFENGLGFEPWLDDMYEASGSTALRVPVSDGLALLEAGEHEDHADDADHEEPAEEHSGDDGHDNGEHDPHVWQDVQNVIHEVGVVRDALGAADSANAETFLTSAESYSAQLTDLDARIRGMVDSVPEDNRILFTSHDSLGYFAHAYGFTIAGSALGSVSTEAADPSAGEIADLIEEIRASGVLAIFVETSETDDLMQQIADDAGVSLAPPLYTDTLSNSDGPATNYLALMEYNATTIVTALGGAAT